MRGERKFNETEIFTPEKVSGSMWNVILTNIILFLWSSAEAPETSHIFLRRMIIILPKFVNLQANQKWQSSLWEGSKDPDISTSSQPSPYHCSKLLVPFISEQKTTVSDISHLYFQTLIVKECKKKVISVFRGFNPFNLTKRRGLYFGNGIPKTYWYIANKCHDWRLQWWALFVPFLSSCLPD